MRASIDRMLAQLREYFGKMPRKSKIQLAILSTLVIVLAIVAVSFFSRTNYVTLINAQSESEAGDVYIALIEMGVPARVEGTRVLVPENRASELKVVLSAQGVLGPGGPDLSIMQSAAAFSVTDSHAKKLYDAQLASEIRAAILASPRIQDAQVIVSSGQSSPFRFPTGAREAKTSVMLTIRGGAMLTSQEAQTIAELIKGSVPGISFENISISDNNFNYYKIGDTTVDFDTEMVSRIALQNRLTEQLQTQVEQLLTPIFGMSKVQVLVNISLDFDTVVRESVEFSPPIAGEMDGIVRSSSEIYESQRNAEAAAGIPGTDTNLAPTEYPYGTLGDGEEYRRAVIERNYEINETRTIIERERGKIESLNIAVLIDENAAEEDYTAEVTNLVSRGLGVPLANVAVERVPFSFHDTSLADMYAAYEEFERQSRQRELIQYIIMWAVILLLGLAFMSLIRRIVKTVKPPPEPEPLLAVGAGIDYLTDDDDEEYEEEPEFEEVDLQKKSTGLEQIEKFIDKDPGAVAALLRNWLSDE